MYAGKLRSKDRRLGISGLRRQLFSNVNMTVNTKLIHNNVAVLFLQTYGFIVIKGLYKTTKSGYTIIQVAVTFHLGLTKL